MHVGIDDGAGRGVQLFQYRFIALDVAAGIHDERVTIALEHIAERAFSHAV